MKNQQQIDQVLFKIAAENFGVEDWMDRNRDSLDFYDCSIRGIRAALRAAYEAGRQDAKK